MSQYRQVARTPAAASVGRNWICKIMKTRIRKNHHGDARCPQLQNGGVLVKGIFVGIVCALSVLTAGCAEEGNSTAKPVPMVYSDDPTSYDLALGQIVFEKTCVSCHAGGVAGAPQLVDTAAWRGRMTQGLDVLISHALHGHWGMPPKGGFQSLTDYDVAAAVAYVYFQGEQLLAQAEATDADCDPAENLEHCQPRMDQRDLILRMLWLLSRPDQ